MNDKNKLRQIIKEKKKLLTEEERKIQSADVCRRLLDLPQIKEAKYILAYYPLPDELDIRDFIMNIDKSKTILLPIVNNEDLELGIYKGKSHLSKGSYNILEPIDNKLFTDYSKIDIVIVPGIAFSREGFRLGRGKGYYDRFLQKVMNAYKIGVGYDFQILEEIPIEPHDVKLDLIL